VTKAGLGRRTGLIGVGSLAGSGLLALALGGTWTATTHALAAIPLVTIAAAALLPWLWHSPHPPETTRHERPNDPTAACRRCHRPAPPWDSPAMPQWELIAEDDEIVGVICPDCPHAARAAGQTGRAGEADPALEAGAAASVVAAYGSCGAEPQQRPARPQRRSSAFGAVEQTSPPVSPRSFQLPEPRRVNRSGWSWKPSSRSLNEASAYDLVPQRPA
jgi:hypothetical protein